MYFDRGAVRDAVKNIFVLSSFGRVASNSKAHGNEINFNFEIHCIDKPEAKVQSKSQIPGLGLSLKS